MPKDVFNTESIDWENIKSQVLLRNVESVTYEFWDPKTKKWVDNLDLIPQGNYLFRGVKIILKWLDPDGVEVNIIRVFRPLFPNFTPEDMYKLEKQDDSKDENADDSENPEDTGA